MGALLVVDFDYFFPRPHAGSEEVAWYYDWGHAESEMYISMLWETRATAFLLNDKPLPRCQGYEHFWERFHIADDAVAYTSESNASAVHPEVEAGTTEVWLYDAHHDAGYDRSTVRKSRESGVWYCDDWMVMYGDRLGWRRLHLRYPYHRAHAFEEEPRPQHIFDRRFDSGNAETPEFTKVFVCRSGAWVPSWCDDQYVAFLDLLDREKVELRPLSARRYDPDEAERHAQAVRDMHKRQRTGLQR